jgi:aminopeptidase
VDITEFDNKLSRMADLCLRIGVNLQKGQELIVTAPIEARALVRHISRLAYRMGAKLVTCLDEDPGMIRDRFDYADDSTFDYAPGWMSRGISEALENGAARLFVVGPYPDLLSGIPTERIVRAHSAMAIASGAEMQFTSESRVNWSTVPFVTGSWASTVFPDLPVHEASQRLWDAVFDATRINCVDPFQAWEEHKRSLNARRDLLQAEKFAALHFYDGRTDLTVGLAYGHRWIGGAVVAANGIEGVCNIPNEEVFTCPHRERTNGRVFFSRPIAIAGALVDDVCVEFRDGSAVSVKAGKGQETLEKLLSSDDSARRLGEIALVPASSPVARSNILFYNALFDENAASHIAFGQSYPACLAEAREDPGANRSSIHIDCMFGNSSMSVDGIAETGAVTPIMRNGEFVSQAARS